MSRFDLTTYEKRGLQYVLLIDRAILHKRYKLAMQIANRYLVSYYQLFLSSVQPKYRFRSRNTYQVALRMVKYFKSYSRRKSWFSKQERLFSLLSVSFHLSHYLSPAMERSTILFDRASAEYARKNSVVIVKRLLNYLKEGKH